MILSFVVTQIQFRLTLKFDGAFPQTLQVHPQNYARSIVIGLQ